MNSIGTILKEARAKKSVSFEEVQLKTKIHPRVLQFLEDDKFENLPSPLFVKSFLKSYAEFLEIKPEDLIRTYEKEKLKEPEQVLFIRAADPRPARDLRPLYAAAGVCVAALFAFALIGGSAYWIRKHWPAPAKIFKTVSAMSKKITLEKPVNIQEASGQWLNSVSRGNFPKISRQSPLSLEIKALDDVWIRVMADGVIAYQSVLKKGRKERWPDKNTFEIWTGNAARMALTLNKNKIFLGSSGKGIVKKMAVSHEGIRLLASTER